MISKTDFRKHFLEKRKTLNTKVLSDSVCKNIINTDIYKKAQNIFAYYPLPFEVNISLLFKDISKNWFLPKIKGDNLKFYEYEYGDKLNTGAFNVLEPAKFFSTEIYPDLIIVPALCVDKNNYRLGYGKGYYDRFLEKYSEENSPITISPIFSCLITNSLPIEMNDKKIDIIITEKDIIYGESYAKN